MEDPPEDGEARSNTVSVKEPYRESSSDDSTTDVYYLDDTLEAFGLSAEIKDADIVEFFKGVGKVVEVSFDEDAEGETIAWVRFATAEEAKDALKLSGNRWRGNPMFLKRVSNGLFTKYVSGFDYTLPEDEIKKQLIEHFNVIGDVQALFLPKNEETGSLKGFAYINMTTNDQKLANFRRVNFHGRKLTIESTNLRKGAKKEMKKNRVDPATTPSRKRYLHNSDSE